MLFKTVELEAIKRGDVTVAFRRWRRPTVKTGGTLNTSVGILAIERVTKIKRSEITQGDAIAIGHKSLSKMLSQLDSCEGDWYRIMVRFAGPDPRNKLRGKIDLSPVEVQEVKFKLNRLDAFSNVGAWTLKVLLTIERYPNVVADILAKTTGFQKEWLKRNVRKLKNLGLTISQQPGYVLSPRGMAVVRRLSGEV